MAEKKQARLSADEVQKDLTSYIALTAIKDYSPNNPAYTLAKVTAAQEAVVTAHAAEKLAEDAMNKARDQSAASERILHDLMIGVDTQVKGQYGESSDELASLGLKKKNEYKRPGGRPKKKP